MSSSNPILPGRYRHYKGREYTVIGAARHSETLEEVVVYRQEYGERGLWVRPAAMFAEMVDIDGKPVPRFQPLAASGEVDAEVGGEVGGVGKSCAAGESDERVKNIFGDLPRQLPAELTEILIRCGEVRIERIVSHGHASPADFWYDQAEHEWVIVLRGAARLQFEAGAQHGAMDRAMHGANDRECISTVELKAGDSINIPAHQRHRVDWTAPDEPTVWLAVFYGGIA